MSSEKPSLDALRIERKAEPNSRPRTWMWFVWISIILVIVALVFWQGRRSRAIQVHTAVARETGGGSGGGDRTVLNASGYVTARRQATASSQGTGKVVEVLIEEGMRGKEGQVLARL